MAPPSNVPGSQLGEMALDRRPRDETDVFLLSSAISLTNLRAVETAALKEMLRNEGSRFFYTVSCPRVACREEGSDWLNLELLRCDWLNLELLRYDWSSDTLL